MTENKVNKGVFILKEDQQTKVSHGKKTNPKRTKEEKLELKTKGMNRTCHKTWHGTTNTLDVNEY